LESGNSKEMSFMADDALFLIDSNIIVYAYENQDSEKKQRAKKLLAKAFSKKATYAVSSQNLAEFAAAYMTKGKGDIKRLQRAVKGIANHKNFIKINYFAQTIGQAISLMEANSTPFWDALIAAAMKENNISNIYTENVKDFNIPGIKAVNPLI